jgi:hypothetical protein
MNPVNWSVRITIIVLLVFVLAPAPEATDSPIPLVRAHAHNDYLHERPLLDALECGFCSIEADVYLVDGALLVAHDRDQCRPERTLEALYLDPLRERVRQHGGRVYPNGPVVHLLVDFKSDGEATWAVLHEMLKQYADVVTEFRGRETTERAVTVLVSGDRPVETIAAQTPRYAAVDGRPDDLDRNPGANLVPLISSNWGDLFKSGKGGILSAEDKETLDDLVRRAHEQGRRIRFWGLPWAGDIWDVLYEHGVDLINADNLSGLQTFLLKKLEKSEGK